MQTVKMTRMTQNDFFSSIAKLTSLASWVTKAVLDE